MRKQAPIPGLKNGTAPKARAARDVSTATRLQMTSPHTFASTVPATGVKAAKRSKRRTVSKVKRDFYSLDEVADRLGLSVRTLERDAAAGLLVIHRFRRTRRVSELAFKKYIRVTRGPTALTQRRRSPHKIPATKTKGESQ